MYKYLNQTSKIDCPCGSIASTPYYQMLIIFIIIQISIVKRYSHPRPETGPDASMVHLQTLPPLSPEASAPKQDMLTIRTASSR